MSELESGAEPDDPYSGRSSDDDSDLWSDGDTDGEWEWLFLDLLDMIPIMQTTRWKTKVIIRIDADPWSVGYFKM